MREFAKKKESIYKAAYILDHKTEPFMSAQVPQERELAVQPVV